MVTVSQENFNKLVNGLNHRMTKIETDVSWLKKIGIYMSSILTAIFVTVVVGII